jgi:hypothetical protein
LPESCAPEASACVSRLRVTANWMSSAATGPSRRISRCAIGLPWLSRPPPKKKPIRETNITAVAIVAATEPIRMSRL